MHWIAWTRLFYGTHLQYFAHPGFFRHFDIDVCIYSACTFLLLLLVVNWILMLIMYSASDFDVDNVQRRELVNCCGV